MNVFHEISGMARHFLTWIIPHPICICCIFFLTVFNKFLYFESFNRISRKRNIGVEFLCISVIFYVYQLLTREWILGSSSAHGSVSTSLHLRMLSVCIRKWYGYRSVCFNPFFFFFMCFLNLTNSHDS